MLDILTDLEYISVWLNTSLLATAGLICLVVGLMVWLGGLALRKLLLAALAALTAALITLTFDNTLPALPIVAAIAAALLTLPFSRLFNAIFFASLAAFITFIFLAGPNLSTTLDNSVIDKHHFENRVQPLNFQDSAKLLKAVSAKLFDITKTALIALSSKHVTIIIIFAAVAFIYAFFLKNFSTALFSAIFGSALVFAGMILLLFGKGSLPITTILVTKGFYASIFAIMVIFGTLVQLCFCTHIKSKPAAPKSSEKNKNTHKE